MNSKLIIVNVYVNIVHVNAFNVIDVNVNICADVALCRRTAGELVADKYFLLLLVLVGGSHLHSQISGP